jgi:hypothetical protein
MLHKFPSQCKELRSIGLPDMETLNNPQEFGELILTRNEPDAHFAVDDDGIFFTRCCFLQEA